MEARFDVVRPFPELNGLVLPDDLLIVRPHDPELPLSLARELSPHLLRVILDDRRVRLSYFRNREDVLSLPASALEPSGLQEFPDFRWLRAYLSRHWAPYRS